LVVGFLIWASIHFGLNIRFTPASKMVVVGTILKPYETQTGLQNSALM
jgi:hypothetical protein